METRESINSRYYERRRKYFIASIGGAILGTVIAVAGFAREYYQTNNVPGVYPLSRYNLTITLTGAGLFAISGLGPLVLDKRARRKRKNELESLSDSAPETDIGLPFSP